MGLRVDATAHFSTFSLCLCISGGSGPRTYLWPPCTVVQTYLPGGFNVPNQPFFHNTCLIPVDGPTDQLTDRPTTDLVR